MSFLLILLFALIQPEGTPVRGRVFLNNAYKTPLYGATITLPSLNIRTSSGIQGAFSIPDVPVGTHPIEITFIGYKTLATQIVVPSASELEFFMERDVLELDEVSVTGEAPESELMASSPIGTQDIAKLPLLTLPRLMGEPDLIRIAQNLPGVKTESDFTGGFHVRGGRNDQNLILLDGVPVYNPWHLFGLFSAFNTEALESAEISKGVFPARFGGRASSVLDIRLQDGSERFGAGYLTVSPLSSSFSYGRPLNQKTSYLMAIRRTYMDPVFWAYDLVNTKESSTPFGESKTIPDNHYSFSDINLKVTHSFNPSWKTDVAYFRSSDSFRTGETVRSTFFQESEFRKNEQALGWLNHTGLIRLGYHHPRYTVNTQAFISRYESDFSTLAAFEGDIGVTEPNTYFTTDEHRFESFRQRFRDTGFQQDATFFLNSSITIHAGVQWLKHSFQDRSTRLEYENGFALAPNGSQPNPRPPITRISTRTSGDSLSTSPIEQSVYVSASVKIGSLSIFPGLRATQYSLGNAQHVMPRISATFDLNDSWFITAGYGQFTQYMQVVGLDLVRAPTDRWFWSDETRAPLTSETYTLGFGGTPRSNSRFTMEGYYKRMDGLMGFSPLAQTEAYLNSDIPQFGSRTIHGNGESYGVEMLWEQLNGPVTGWVGYSLSWAWNQFDELNRGDRFPSRTDKRHDIQTFWNWDFATNWSIGLLFNFKTGQPITFSTGFYVSEPDPLGVGGHVGSDNVILQTNSYRLPAYHRLDVNLTWRNRRLLRRNTEISLNIVNVYNRLNVLTIDNQSTIELISNHRLRVTPKYTQLGQLPILPVLSMRIALGGDAK